MLLFYQSQALVAPLFALPMLIAGQSQLPLGIADALGLLIGAIALGGEALAHLLDFSAMADCSSPLARRSSGKVSLLNLTWT